MNTRYYVGVDIGKKKCNAAIMDQQGLIDDEFTFKKRKWVPSIESRFRGLVRMTR